ncbi:NAD-dependent epimerase/dehydratase family protein [Chloroflexota bacterium]
MKVLVTGGSGFIGTNLIEYYLSKEAGVITFDIAPLKNPEHKSCCKEMKDGVKQVYDCVAENRERIGASARF